MKQGQLHRVNSYALSNKNSYRHNNQKGVDIHGYLWVATGEMAPLNKAAHIMRSLATGETMLFYRAEMEAVDE